MTPEEAKQLASGPFGSQLLKIAASYVVPFFWATPEDGAWRIHNNGSAFILDCGAGPFIVTASHVYEGFLNRKSKSETILCQVGNLSFDPVARLIDQGKLHVDIHGNYRDPDIATFQITPQEIETIGKVPLTGEQTTWPPPPPEIGKGVFFAGYPGQERISMKPLECSFGIYAGLTNVTSVNDRIISCQFEREYWNDNSGLGLPPEGYDIGGISGAPLLTLVERQGLYTWRLGGIIYSSGTELCEIMFAVRANYIADNGDVIK